MTPREHSGSIFVRPAAALLQPDDLRCGWVAEIRDGRFVGWHGPEVKLVDAQVIDAVDEVWLAAPLMMHAHLESFDAPSETWPRDSFAAWANALLSWRHAPELQRMTAGESANASATELAAAGCGLVFTSVSEPGADFASANTDAGTDVNGNDEANMSRDGGAYPEVLSAVECFAPDPADAEPLATELLTADRQTLALHAPFSVSPGLAREAMAWLGRDTRRRMSIHLGEHDEERRVLADHAGPLADLLQARGRELPETRWSSSVAWLDDVAPGAQPRLLAVHAGDLTAKELQRLVAKQVEVVWCPGTHQYFSRPTPAFVEAGLPAPMLGCDSRASNASLDPLRELRIAARLLPRYSASQWWAALTSRPAQWLGRADDWGSLQEGRLARPLRLSLQALQNAGSNLEDAATVCDSLVSDARLSPIAPVTSLCPNDFRSLPTSS